MPGIVLMENAGRGCAELLMRLNPDKKPVADPLRPRQQRRRRVRDRAASHNHDWPVSVCAFSEVGMAGSGDSLAADPKLSQDATRNYILLRRTQARETGFPTTLEHGSAPSQAVVRRDRVVRAGSSMLCSAPVCAARSGRPTMKSWPRSTPPASPSSRSISPPASTATPASRSGRRSGPRTRPRSSRPSAGSSTPRRASGPARSTSSTSARRAALVEEYRERAARGGA